MKNLLCLISFCIIQIPSICFADDVRDQLPKERKYEFIKANSISQNLDVFKQYESIKSKKVIFLCFPNSISFKVEAKWDLDFKTQQDAEKIAKDACIKSSSTERYVVIGFKLKDEFKF
jgi:hypothetical protein